MHFSLFVFFKKYQKDFNLTSIEIWNSNRLFLNFLKKPKICPV